MGKGDSKTAKGKRATSSYGNVRSHAAPKASGSFVAPAVKKTAGKTAAKTAVKAPAKKVVARKTPAR